MEAISGTMMMLYMAVTIGAGWALGRMMGEMTNPSWHKNETVQVVTSIFSYVILLLVVVAVVVNLVPHKLQHIVLGLLYIASSGLALAAYWQDWNRHS